MSKVPSGYHGHERDALKLQAVPDPKATIGHLRVLQRTDGFFVLYDKDLPLGETADGGALFASLDDAKARARVIAREVPKDAPKFDWDTEWFAAMKRAMVNRFAPHPPAETVVRA